jgi:hypothetical protein
MILLFLLFPQFSAFGSSEITIAVWNQDKESTYDQAQNKEIFKVQEYILPIAQVVDGRWSEASAVLSPQTWTIAFNGKNIGTCKSNNFKNQPFDSFVNIQEPIGKVFHPDATKNQNSTTIKSLRPLVLVSVPNFQDHDNWRPSKLTSKEEKIIKAEFKKKFPSASDCVEFEKDNLEHPKTYSDSDVKIKKVYRSNKKTLIAEVSLEKWDCDSFFDEPFEAHWFALTSDNKIKYLSKRMSLIDAGDYDKSGRSELVFEDNSDGGDDDNARGYSIWDANFNVLAKRVRFMH